MQCKNERNNMRCQYAEYFGHIPRHPSLEKNVMLEMMPGICQQGWTTWISRYQKGKTSLDLNEARDDEVQDGSGPYANNLHLTPDR